jgi:hypothetical protein
MNQISNVEQSITFPEKSQKIGIKVFDHNIPKFNS